LTIYPDQHLPDSGQSSREVDDFFPTEPARRRNLAVELQEKGLIPPEWPWRALAGGRTNHLWHVGVGPDSCVVKLYPRDRQTPLFRNDGTAEAAVLAALQGHGLAPRLLARAHTAQGPCVIYRHVEGQPWQGDPVPLARVLRRLHGLGVHIPLPDAPSGSAALCAQTRGILKDCASEKAADFLALQPKSTVPPSRVRRLIHGDAVAGNIIQGGDGLRLIDWQCPMSGEPSADIAIVLSPAMQCLHGGPEPDARFRERFFATYGERAVERRYRRLAPLYHWRMAAYCLWKAEHGARDYAKAMALELTALDQFSV